MRKVVVVTDDKSKYMHNSRLPNRGDVLDRSELGRVQETFREVKGVAAIIYERTCAA